MSGDPRDCPVCGHRYTKCTCAPEHRVRLTDSTADAAKLLPCPFCGGEAVLGDVPEENGVAVGCKNCLAYGPLAIHVKEDATHHAIYCWNRRANTRPQPAPPAGEPDFEKMAEEIEDWMPDEQPGEMSHKEYIRQFAAFLKNRIDFGINPCPLSADQIRHLVDRFLGWRLPKPWNPDNGISYVRPNYMHPPADHDWPTGTNLFDWSQAEAMVRYMIEGMPGHAARQQKKASADPTEREGE